MPTEQILVEVNTFGLVGSDEPIGNLIRPVAPGEKVFVLDESTGLQPGDGIAPGDGSAGVFRVVETGSVVVGGESYPSVTVTESPDTTIPDGIPVWFANAVSDSAPVIAFDITSDRFDISPSACVITIKEDSQNAEYTPIVAPAEVLPTETSTYDVIGVVDADVHLRPDARSFVLAADERPRPGIIIKIGDRPLTYRVLQVTGAGDAELVLDSQIGAVKIAEIDSTVYEFGASATTNQTQTETTGSSDGSGGFHDHSIPVIPLARDASADLKNVTVDPRAGDWVLIKGIPYQVASYYDPVLTVTGYFMTDMVESEPVYLLTLRANEEVKAALWRHRSQVQVSPTVHFKQTAQVVTFQFRMTETGLPLVEKRFIFYRPGIVGSVEDLGGNRFRYWLHGHTPGVTNELAILGVSDYFQTQTIDGGTLDFGAPQRPGWESDQ